MAQTTLARCPLHPREPCGVSRQGTYARVEPPGTRVAQFYCRRGQTTFGLLPDCLASPLSSSEDEVEQVVVATERALVMTRFDHARREAPTPRPRSALGQP